MAEDFTTYTEVDPNSRITKTATRVTWTGLTRNEEAYVYDDKGSNFFAGNFTHYLTIKFTAKETSCEGGIWALTNLLDDLRGIDFDSAGDYLALQFFNPTIPDELRLFLSEIDGGAQAVSGNFLPTVGTVYYLKIVRDESVGSFGTLYCYIYSDAARTTLLSTLSVALNTSKKDFRYVHVIQTWDSTTNHATSGYSENLTIENWGGDFSSNAPSVTTQAVTDKAPTTVTGNGNVTNLGNPIATDHEHCWATHPNPTTLDNVTTSAPSSTGAFTSAITGLLQNTHYWIRSYIVNSIGTFYGNLIEFTTSPSTSIVTTDLVTEIATTTALGNGSIDNNGGSRITQHGVCWSTSANPTIDEPLVPTTAGGRNEDGGTDVIGEFFSLMTGLGASTTYHIRAYAINNAGVAYGADVTFITFAVGAPIVTTEETTNVEPVSALGHGNIRSEGASAVTQHGHCWSTSASPTTSDSKTTNGAASTGAFTSIITGLTAGTAYYIRAYATNEEGTAYGNNELINDFVGELVSELRIINEYLCYTSLTLKQRALLGRVF